MSRDAVLNKREALKVRSTKPLGLRRYLWRDWLRQRPLVDAYKEVRHQLHLRHLLRLKAPDGDADNVRQEIRSRNVIMTLAFGDALFTDWQARLISKYVPGALHIVADNSPTAKASAAVAEAAACRDVTLFRLPQNPWTGRVPARSHGFALTWIWRNVILPGRPKAFGFVDHDIFPLAPTDPFAMLDNRIAYGARRRDYGCSYIWPGFCFFRFSAVENTPLNFSPSYLNGLETGGMNWHVIYRHLAANQIAWFDLVNEPLTNDPHGPYVQRAGLWIHMSGLSWNTLGVPPAVADQQRETKRRYIESVLAPHIATT